jgi:TP901 family phage tail tape measure protein
MPGPLARLYATLGLDSREFDSGIGKAQKSISGFGRGTDLAMAGIAGGIAGGLIGTIGAARDWESAFAGVRKTMDTTGLSADEQTAAFGKLEGELRDLAKTIPITAVELAGLAEAGGAMGVARDDLAEFARVTALIGTTTDVVAQDAATSLGKIGTVMRMTAADYDNFGSTLVDLGNKGSSTESQIIAVANRISGTASTIGLSVDEMLGWSAALANVGIEAEAGGSSFQRFAFTVQQAALMGGNKLSILAQTAGMTDAAFQQLWGSDTNAALTSVMVGFSKLSETESMVRRGMLGLDDIRISDFMTKLTGNVDNLTGSLGVAETAWGDNTAMMTEAEKRFDTVDSKLQLFWNRITDVGITLGNALLPPLTLTVEHVGNLVGILGDAAAAFPAVTSVVAPLVTALAALTAVRFGARFMGLGGLETLISSGLGKAWRAAGGSAAVKGAVAFAGAAAQVAYEGAAFLVSKFVAVASAMWTALGRPGSAIVARAMQAGAAAGTAYAGASGAGGFIGTVAAAVAGMAPLAIPAVIAIGAKPMVDQAVNSLDIGQTSKDLATGKFIDDQLKAQETGAERLTNFRWPWEKGGMFGGPETLAERIIQPKETASAVEDALDDAVVKPVEGLIPAMHTALGRLGDVPFTPPEVADPMADEFAAARKAVLQGFGSIKEALKKGSAPQLISKHDRLDNMEGRMQKVMKNLRKAVEVNDPINVGYWSKAAAKQAVQIDKMRGKSSTTTGAIKRKFASMGIDIEGTWKDTRSAAERESGRTARTAISDAQSIKTGIDAIDLTSSGTNLMLELAAGIRAGISEVSAAAHEAAAAAALPIKSDSPPKVGPLSTIDKWGVPLMEAWAGGIEKGAGRVRLASDRMAGAFRPSAHVPAFALAGGGSMAGGVHIHVGTLIADEGGIDELERRMSRRLRLRGRGTGHYNDPN